MLVDKLFEKALLSHETCALVNKSICEKLVLSLELPITFGEIFKVILVPIFIPNFGTVWFRYQLGVTALL